MRLSQDVFDLNFQYLWRKDTNPTFVEVDTNIKTGGILAELVISPKRDPSSYYFTLLYNQVDSDLDQSDFESATVSATYLFARNLRGNIEYTRNLDQDYNRVGLGFVSAF